MAKVGLSKPYYAKYAANAGSVTYTGGAVMGKAVEATIEPDDSDTEYFYADNGPAESAQQFAGGQLTLEIDRLLASVVGDLYGITPGSSATPVGSTVEFSGNIVVPYVGIGLISKNIVNNESVWMGVMLPKVQFELPTLEMTTQGEDIEFTGNELSATILRDDTADAKWLKLGWFSTEADAEAWIKGLLNIAT